MDPVTDRLNAFAQADQSLQTFLAAFNTSQIRVSPGIIGTASRLVATYELQSHDAVVAARLRRRSKYATSLRLIRAFEG